MSIRGVPDFLLSVSGYFIALELKSSHKSKVSALQQYNVDRINKAQGRAYIVYPENWDIIYDELKLIASR